ncbi:MAG: choice-of-anchor X domain-containing protein [Patescibacteria group bacterium]
MRVVRLYDDGTNGDAVAQDSIYTNYYHVQKRADSGYYKIDITASDLDNNRAESENAVIVSVLP